MSDSKQDPRKRLLAEMAGTEHEVLLAGVSTAIIEGGAGPPVVLLHGPGASATHWMQVFGPLTATRRVIAPDLPGQGASEVLEGSLDAERVLTWLGDLIEGTCPSPPVLVGNALGGAIAARFACRRGDRLSRLVLVDALGLVPFEPAPDFGAALHAFLAGPDPTTHDRLWRQCALDLDKLRGRLGGLWDTFEAYNLDRAGSPAVQEALGSLMEQFVTTPIPPAELARIDVPTTLIWGRQDRATPLAAAERAATRYGWALQVIERCGDDPPTEQPEAFLRALDLPLQAAA